MENSSSKRVCIVGAGLSGLILAMRLSRSGFDVTLVEGHTYPGGLLASSRIGSEYLELLPHHIRKTDRALLSLIKEVGISDKLEWFDSLWYGRASHKKLGYFTDGFAGLINVLVQNFIDNGGNIFYSTTVNEITKNDKDEYMISCILNNSGKTTLVSDYCIFTGSCRAFVNVSHSLPISMNIKDQLMNITYKANLTLMMILKKQHSEVYYQSVGISPESPFRKIVNHSNCFGKRTYGGNIVYMVGECSVSDPLWISSDEEIKEKYFAGLRKLYPSIKKSDIKSWRLTKTRYAVSEKAPGMDLTNPIPGLYICSAALSLKAPENKMETVVEMAGNIARDIIELQAKKENEASLVTPINTEVI